MATKDKMLMIYEDRTCELVPIKEVSDQHIETARGLFPLEDAQTFLDIRNSNMVYIVNLDLPARIEVAKLKQLRRSTALLRMFEFDIKKKSDLGAIFPWIVIIALILFK